MRPDLTTPRRETFVSLVLAVLIGDLYEQFKARNSLPAGTSVLQRAVQAALHEVEGTYGIAVVCRDEPDALVVARKGSPLIIGVGDEEYVVASDASAIVEHTQQVIYLNDNEMAVLRPDSFKTTTIDHSVIPPRRNLAGICECLPRPAEIPSQCNRKCNDRDSTGRNRTGWRRQLPRRPAQHSAAAR